MLLLVSVHKKDKSLMGTQDMLVSLQNTTNITHGRRLCARSTSSGLETAKEKECRKQKEEDLHADTGTCTRTVEVMQKRRQERNMGTESTCGEDGEGWMRNGHFGKVRWRTSEAPGEAQDDTCCDQ